jgi:hypothetical protein
VGDDEGREEGRCEVSTQTSMLVDEQVAVTVRAHATARAWLNAFLATGDEENRPVLNRTLCLEFFAGGVQLIACDGTALFRSWVPLVADDKSESAVNDWPVTAELPDRSIVIMDTEGFGLAFMRSLLRVTADEERQFELLAISTAPADDGATLALGEEFATERLTLRACGQRIDLRLYDGPYVNWRNARLGMDDVERVDGLTIGTHVFQLVGKLKAVNAVDLEFYGDRKHVVFAARGVTEVRGLLMPMRRQKVDDE